MDAIGQQGTMKSRVHSTGSFSIRFNPSSIEDEDSELDIFTPEKTKASPPVKLLSSSDLTTNRRPSSAPVSEVCTPQDSSPKQGRPPLPKFPPKSTPPASKDETEKSFISGIKERIQDPLNSFIDRFEELKAESQIVETIERKLRKSESLDVAISRLPIKAGTTIKTRHGSLDEDDSKKDESQQPSPNFVDDFFSEPKTQNGDSDPIITNRHSYQKLMGKATNISDKELSADTTETQSTSDDAPDCEAEFFDAKDEINSDPLKTSYNYTSIAHSMMQLYGDLFTKTKGLPLLVGFIAFMVVPLPAYISGMLIGVLLGVGGLSAYQWLTKPPPDKRPPPLPDLSSLPPLIIPQLRGISATKKLQGWMNELAVYNEEKYHINQTHSVYVTLEQSQLRLQTPRTSAPKRAMWNENIPPISFTKQRFFDLRGAKIFLLPDKLISKRYWSKKYPLCIVVREVDGEDVMNDEDSTEKTTRDMSDDGRSPIKKSATVEGSPDKVTTKVNTDRTTTLYLFARTGRDKEEWYSRLLTASQGYSPSPTAGDNPLLSTAHWTKQNISRNNTGDDVTLQNPPQEQKTINMDAPSSALQNYSAYLQYMNKIMPKGETSTFLSKESQEQQHASHRPSIGSLEKAGLCDSQVLWVNALLSRSLWDLLREKYWCKKIQDKLQKKLCKIHVPYFIDELAVTGIELGNEVPVIRRASLPYMNERGLWVQLDVTYTGGLTMTLETKCNLMKLKKDPVKMCSEHRATHTMTHTRSAVTHSDEEDSAESSTDDETEENGADVSADDKGTPRSQRGAGKLLRLVDRIAQSRYFQQATEYKYIRRAMEEVSNTRLILNVELRSIRGTLAVNIPPPPTNRVWYGFSDNPELCLVARPRVGDRELNLTHITDWIEKKLAVEFQRVFVMPNMDDLILPVMYDNLNKSPSDVT